MTENSSTLWVLLGGVVGLTAIAAAFLAMTKKKKISLPKSLPGVPVTPKATLTFQEIVAHFKDPKVLNLLKSDSNLIAIAIRENLGNGKTHIILCVFDKEKGELVGMDGPAAPIIYEVEMMDADLMAQFGSKEMLVLS